METSEVDAGIGVQFRLRLAVDLAAVPCVYMQVLARLHNKRLQWHDLGAESLSGTLGKLQYEWVLAVTISLNAVGVELFDTEFPQFDLLGLHYKLLFYYKNIVTSFAQPVRRSSF